MTPITLVVPIYNEENAIPLFYQAVRGQPGLDGYDVEILFVDDGSRDRSVAVVKALIQHDRGVRLITLTRNFGKEPALLAGLDHARGEAVIPIDVDLQDPVELIPPMLEHWRAGAEIVLAKRADRASDSLFKRESAHWFYRIHRLLSATPVEENVGDFRLLSRKTVERIKAMPERNLFMKGLMQWVGGQQAIVEYQRPRRSAGHGKFNFWRLWNLALEGITSFSTLPLRIWTYIGVVVAGSAFVYGGWTALSKLMWGNQVPGYTSLMAALLFLGGVQLIGIGILGEYVGRIYTETKLRPRYIIDSISGPDGG